MWPEDGLDGVDQIAQQPRVADVEADADAGVVEHVLDQRHQRVGRRERVGHHLERHLDAARPRPCGTMRSRLRRAAAASLSSGRGAGRRARRGARTRCRNGSTAASSSVCRHLVDAPARALGVGRGHRADVAPARRRRHAAAIGACTASAPAACRRATRPAAPTACRIAVVEVRAQRRTARWRRSRAPRPATRCSPIEAVAVEQVASEIANGRAGSPAAAILPQLVDQARRAARRAGRSAASAARVRRT